jgi:hypothetical protein
MKAVMLRRRPHAIQPVRDRVLARRSVMPQLLSANTELEHPVRWCVRPTTTVTCTFVDPDRSLRKPVR